MKNREELAKRHDWQPQDTSMTDDERITISRSQFESWEKSWDFKYSFCFDDLKAHVSRPKRREWKNVIRIYGGHDSHKELERIHVREVLPGDIGPMSPNEIYKLLRQADYTDFAAKECLKALGVLFVKPDSGVDP